MKAKQKRLAIVCSIALLGACSFNQASNVALWRVAPTIITKHGGNIVDAMYKIGRYHQGQNRYDLASIAYQNALAADESFVEARNGLGVVYSMQGKYREAIKVFLLAVEQAPNTGHLHNNLGYAYYLQGRYSDSVTALELASLLIPDNLRVLNNLGLAYAKMGDKKRSRKAFSHTICYSETTREKAETAYSVRSKLQSCHYTPIEDIGLSPSLNVKPLQSEMEMLNIPKDRGVIRPAAFKHVAVVDTHVRLIKLSTNVTELRVQPYSETANNILKGDVSTVKSLRIEVSNGNGVTGAARKVGLFLISLGYPKSRLTNQKPFQVEITKIQYRTGYHGEAQLLQASLPTEHKLVLRNDMRAGTSVRLILGKDMYKQLATNIKEKKV